MSKATTAELLTFAVRIASELGVPGVRGVAAEGVRALCDAEGATVFVLDPATLRLSFDVVTGPATIALEHASIPLGQGVAGQVGATRTPLLVADVPNSALASKDFDLLSGFHTGSLITVPLLGGADLLGVLQAVRSVGRAPFDGDDLATLSAMAPFVAAALLHARLHASQRAAQERVQKNNSELETRVRERTVQIARAKEEWEKTFDAISEPISVQEGFVIRRANTAYAAQAGVRVQELVGKTCHLVLAGRDSPCTGCPLFEAAGSTHEVVMRGARLQVSAFESRLEGGMQGQVLAYRDVTVQRRLEERLKSTERLASLGQLASGAAHEINNPLAFLTSNLATLRAVVDERRQVEGGVSFEPADVTDVDEMLTDALNGARRISEIVRLLQTLSPHGASRLEDVEVEVPLQRAVERVFGPGSGVVLELAARRKVFTAPGRLEEALEHVLKNARQATAHPHQVTVATTVEGDDVVVRVKDSGVGISSEVLPHVFDPFFTTRKVGSGVGLGLTSTWGIVQQLGGRVAIHSEVGRGTTIELRLPLGAMQLGSASPAAVGRYAERAPKSEPAEQAPPTQSA